MELYGRWNEDKTLFYATSAYIGERPHGQYVELSDGVHRYVVYTRKQIEQLKKDGVKVIEVS